MNRVDDYVRKGAKPADIPIEQLIKYQMVINTTSPARLGIKVPQERLLRADDLIR